MKDLLDEFITNCKNIQYFSLSPAAYAMLKEELKVDLLQELHRYRKITLRVKADQIEDIYVEGNCQ